MLATPLFTHFEGADAPLVGLDLGGGCLQLPLSLLALRAQALRGALLLQRGALGSLRLPAQRDAT